MINPRKETRDPSRPQYYGGKRVNGKKVRKPRLVINKATSTGVAEVDYDPRDVQDTTYESKKLGGLHTIRLDITGAYGEQTWGLGLPNMIVKKHARSKHKHRPRHQKRIDKRNLAHRVGVNEAARVEKARYYNLRRDLVKYSIGYARENTEVPIQFIVKAILRHSLAHRLIREYSHTPEELFYMIVNPIRAELGKKNLLIGQKKK